MSDHLNSRLEPPVKRQKHSPVSLEFVDGIAKFGEIVDGPEGYGEWRSVPGFSPEKLLVSDIGFYQVFRRGNWFAPSLGAEVRKEDGSVRHQIKVDGINYKVFRIVCRAFHGPCPKGQTCDHRDQNTSNNHASNLRWATPEEQAENRRAFRARQDAREVRIRGNDWPEDRTWQVFGSVNRAAKEYGLSVVALRGIANETVENSNTPYMVEYTEAAESQSPLEAGDDSNLEISPLDPPPAATPTVGPSTTKEVWKFAPGVDSLKISDRGRVQTKNPTGDGWGRMRTPTAVAGHVYASVRYNGSPSQVHVMVYITFVGPVPEGMTIDHIISYRKFDNRLCAIRPATPSQQNSNKILKPIGETHDSSKKAIRGKDTTNPEAEWEEFKSVRDAARVLTARFPGTVFDSGGISRSARNANKGSKHLKWIFEFL